MQSHELLTKDAPEGYTPHYHKVKPNDKDPVVFENGKIVSWEHNGKITYKQACERLKAGGNVGIAALENDRLCIIDNDNFEVTNPETEKKTLSTTTRKRLGKHSFYFTSKPEEKASFLKSCKNRDIGSGSNEHATGY